MKRKTQQVIDFIEGLHKSISNNPQLRKNTSSKGEVQIQAEIRPLIIRYLEKYYEKNGVKDFEAKANQSFYWEGQEGIFGKKRKTTFGSRNYPDFIITDPYLIAIEYKQSPNGSMVKQGIGQSIMHTLCEDFDFVYYLFHDESDDRRIEKSIEEKTESLIINKMWKDFNVFIRFI
jgi:hypothetical protein